MADIFDTLLTNTMDIYKKGVGASDTYNQPNQTKTVAKTGVACNIGRSLGGKEFKVSKEVSISVRTVYCRPVTDFVLDEHYWLFFENGFWNITNIRQVYDSTGAAHHLQIVCEEYKP